MDMVARRVRLVFFLSCCLLLSTSVCLGRLASGSLESEGVGHDSILDSRKRGPAHTYSQALQKRALGSGPSLPDEAADRSKTNVDASRKDGDSAPRSSRPPQSQAANAQLKKDTLGLVRANNAINGQEFNNALKASGAVPLLQVATMKARSDEMVRKAMQRQPNIKDPTKLRFTPAEKAESRQWHRQWLHSVNANRQISAMLYPVFKDIAARDHALARAGVRTQHRRGQRPEAPIGVFPSPKPRLLGTKDPARLESFTQDWRARHKYEKSPSDLPLAKMDRKSSSQELLAALERNHGHQRHLRKSWSFQQFETDSKEHKKLHPQDNPTATKEQALRSGKLYRGHSFSYPGEMTMDNELSKAMREKQGLPPEQIPEGGSTPRHRLASAFQT